MRKEIRDLFGKVDLVGERVNINPDGIYKFFSDQQKLSEWKYKNESKYPSLKMEIDATTLDIMGNINLVASVRVWDEELYFESPIVQGKVDLLEDEIEDYLFSVNFLFENWS